MCVYTSASIDSRDCLHSKPLELVAQSRSAARWQACEKWCVRSPPPPLRRDWRRDFLAPPKTKPCNESHVTQLNAFPRSPSKYQIAPSHSNKSSAENMCAQHRREFVRSLSLAKFIKQKNIPGERRRVENGEVKCIRGVPWWCTAMITWNTMKRILNLFHS